MCEKRVFVTADCEKSKCDDDYDPHTDRHVEHGLTRGEGLTNVIKGCFGTGLLALPQAFYYAGTINGIVLFITICFFGTYCFHLLLGSMYLLCKIKKVGFLSYPKAVEAAFEIGPDCLRCLAPIAEFTIDLIFVTYQVGALCVYVIFMAVNVKMVADIYVSGYPLYIYLLGVFIPCGLLTMIPNMKVFSKLSLFANLATLATMGIMAYYVSQDLPDFNSLPTVGDLQNFPLFFGTAVFALLSVPIVISVENKMADPKWFTAPFGTLNISFGLVGTIYLILGLMGYWRYGSEIKASITLNFPEKDLLAQGIRFLYSIAICVTFSFNAMVPRDIIWYTYVEPKLSPNTGKRQRLFADYGVRIGLIILCFVFSISIPLLGPIISLVGGVCLSIIGIILPALMEICALYPDKFGKGKFHLWKDLLIILIGIFCMATSMYSSVREIVLNL